MKILQSYYEVECFYSLSSRKKRVFNKRPKKNWCCVELKLDRGVNGPGGCLEGLNGGAVAPVLPQQPPHLSGSPLGGPQNHQQPPLGPQTQQQDIITPKRQAVVDR